MTKLNRNGWGLSMFLIFFLLLVTFLIYVVYIVNSTHIVDLSSSSNKNDIVNNDASEDKSTVINDTDHKSLQDSMKTAALEYKNSLYPNMDGVLVVSLSNLIDKGYLYDNSGCVGYVVVGSDAKSYIKCTDYVSDGFDESLLNE